MSCPAVELLDNRGLNHFDQQIIMLVEVLWRWRESTRWFRAFAAALTISWS